MKQCTLLVVFYLLGLSPVVSQSVGLVLSGGGAKGAVHVGFIKALEEQEIPIDYISGTSIGAIVGSMYAMAYSPDEMLELFLSEDFKYWQTGKVEESYLYYFRKKDPSPEFTRFTVNVKDSVKVNAIQLPSSLINPIQMNQAFMGLFSRATAYSRNNFDYLFVPFLCVASDVYNKKAVVFREGDLGDAVRASMTFPLVFKPILKDSIPLYDGGIYDNFPVRPLRKAFNPDYLIGSVVASISKKKPSEHGLFEMMENMIMQPTEYRIPARDGYMERFSLEDVSLLDFQKGKELFDMGYQRGLEVADSIRQKVLRRVPLSEVTARREAFKRELPPLKFKDVHITGVTPQQEAYIQSQFHSESDGLFTMEEFKRIYFKLLADSKIKEIVPKAIYKEEEGWFDLELQVTINDEILVAFGGNISSSNANQLYLGLGYQSLGDYAIDFTLDMQVGNAFSGVAVQSKIELPSEIPVYIKGNAAYRYRKFFESDKLFLEDELTTFLQQEELYAKCSLGFPFLIKAKSEITLGYGRLLDRYYPTSAVNFATTPYDKSISTLFLASLALKRNTLDAKQYPVRGQAHLLIAQFVSGNEIYKPYDTNSSVGRRGKHQSWLQVKGLLNNFYEMNKTINLGYLVEGVLSSKNLLSNYTATLVQAPAFTPTPHSKLDFNDSFRANEYLAGGVIPIVKLSNLLHCRADLHAFAPVRKVLRGSNNVPYYDKPFRHFEYLTELSCVLQLPFASIGLYGNYYSSPANNWNFGLNIGFLLFGEKFIE